MTEEEMKYCRILEESCDLQKEDQFLNYIDSITNLKVSKNPEVLRVMLNCFRDTMAGEIQYELVEACEAFPEEIYVEIFLDEGLAFSRIAPYWFDLMFRSLLNTFSCVKILRERIGKIDKGKYDFYKKYINNLSVENGKYKDILIF